MSDCGVRALCRKYSANQTRTASPANEISGMSATVGSTWAAPAYDQAGNMTTIPIPTNLTSSYTAVYDAWNRLVSLANGSTTVETYAYDGLSRRVVKGVYVSGALDHNEHAYFNENWQILEVRKEVSGTINSNPLEQYIWHPFYIDALVLRDYDVTTSALRRTIITPLTPITTLPRLPQILAAPWNAIITRRMAGLRSSMAASTL